jgi:steroid 5-alpha reductase family enzyme
MTLPLLVGNSVAVLGMMLVLWLWSLHRRDAGVVDPWWSMGFLLVFVRSLVATGGVLTPGKLLAGGCVALWAIRLWLHLLLRARGRPEDPRYQAFRRRFGPARFWWVSLFVVFLLQAVLMLAISLPLVLAAVAPGPDRLAWNDGLGAAVFVAGFVFEAVADAQLTRFRGDPTRHGAVLDTGVWRYSRHPNYFGETLVMWSFWLFCLDRPAGLYTAFAPALMTFMLLRVSGVTMLEKQLGRSKPKYAEYVRRTSVFVPRPPRA